MNEPFTFRPSDGEDPRRGEKFEAILVKRAANPTDVLRKLLDAYIRSDGAVPFPVDLHPARHELKVKRSQFGGVALGLFSLADEVFRFLT